MNREELKTFWLSEEKKVFKGWDFSYIDDRTEEEPLPWSYDQIVKGYLKSDMKLLDMGTGGGEYLLTLKHPYENTYATEAYPPNVELCQKSLSPLGITVKQVFDDKELPFENQQMDIIINRHESFDMKEIARILKPGGIFITQQVGGSNNKALSKRLIREFEEVIGCEHDLLHNQELVKKEGFEILKGEEYFPYLRFFDIGALVYFAKIIEWEFPDFSVEKCIDRLYDLEELREKQGFVESTEHRFILVAKNIDK